MGINVVIDKWVDDQRAKRSPLKDFVDIVNNINTETENNKKVKPTLSSSTSSKISELTIMLAKAKETEAMDDAACDTAVQQLIDSVSKVVEKKTTKYEVVVVETIEDKIDSFKNTPEYAELNKALGGKGEEFINAAKALATALDNNKDKLEGILGAPFTNFFSNLTDPEVIPFDEDKKPKTQKKEKKVSPKIIDVDENSIKEVKANEEPIKEVEPEPNKEEEPKKEKRQDAIKLFKTREEAMAELKKEEEKEKLERVEYLPPVTINRIPIPENYIFEITNESVKSYLTDLFVISNI